jgi:esterase
VRRSEFQHDGLTFSYLDAGGDGQPLAALHAHWMEASTYEGFAAAMAPRWRVVALDQRGHGHSGHAASYEREDYLGDLGAWFVHLGVGQPIVLVGNSLGGVNAYQYAARHPDQVRALIIEDIGAEIHDDASFILDWSGVFQSREDLAARTGPRFVPYLQDSFRRSEAGWTLAFDPTEIALSQRRLCGDHWSDWLATDCPALLIRGAQSRLTTATHLEAMAARRPNTRLVTLDAGHVVHLDDPTGFVAAVRAFLDSL